MYQAIKLKRNIFCLLFYEHISVNIVPFVDKNLLNFAKLYTWKFTGKQPDVLSLLKKVEYSCRFAMGLFYKPPTTIDVPWGAKYFYDDPCIRYVAIDNKKRGAGKDTYLVRTWLYFINECIQTLNIFSKVLLCHTRWLDQSHIKITSEEEKDKFKVIFCQRSLESETWKVFYLLVIEMLFK